MAFVLVGSWGCSDGDATTTTIFVTTQPTSTSVTTSTPTTSSTTVVPVSIPPEYQDVLLFAATTGDLPPDSETVARARLVTLDAGVLLDDAGNPREIALIGFNLFDDVFFAGVVDAIAEEGGAPTWSGTLDGVEFSYFMIVYVDGVFLVHVASPLGVYEVSSLGGDTYLSVLIDQTGMQEG